MINNLLILWDWLLLVTVDIFDDQNVDFFLGELRSVHFHSIHDSQQLLVNIFGLFHYIVLTLNKANNILIHNFISLFYFFNIDFCLSLDFLASFNNFWLLTEQVSLHLFYIANIILDKSQLLQFLHMSIVVPGNHQLHLELLFNSLHNYLIHVAH